MNMDLIFNDALKVACQLSPHNIIPKHLIFFSHLCRQLPLYILHNSATLDLYNTRAAIEFLESRKYLLGKSIAEATEYMEHLLFCLSYILENSAEIIQILNSVVIPSPTSHKQLIKDSLFLANSYAPIEITKTTTQQAILASWFFRMRQEVGSCFATALSIQIQNEQPLNFLSELISLLSQGKIIRVVDSQETMVPLIPEFGLGHLHAHLPSEQVEGVALSELLPIIFKHHSEKLHEDFLAIQKHPQRRQEIILATINSGTPSLFVLITEILKTLPYANIKTTFESIQKILTAAEDIFLLRTWDYTLASFSEARGKLAQRIIYIALGWNSDQKEGLGQHLMPEIESLFNAQDEKLKLLRDTYHSMQSAATASSVMMKTAANSERMQSASRAYTARTASLSAIETEFQQEREKSECLSNLFNLITDQVLARTPDFFAELYSIQKQPQAQISIQADSPARFQLVSKHDMTKGEWKRITNTKEFLSSIFTFFRSIEEDVCNTINLQNHTNVTKEVEACFNIIYQKTQTKQFVLYAFLRIAHNYNVSVPSHLKDPVAWLINEGVTPWSLPSGGSPDTLLSTFYLQSDEPKKLQKPLLNCGDIVKLICFGISEYSKSLQFSSSINLSGYMLASSPTHVFRVGLDLPISLQLHNFFQIEDTIQKRLDLIIDSMHFPLFHSDQITTVLSRIKTEFNITVKYTNKSITLMGAATDIKTIITQDYGAEHAEYVVESAFMQSLPFVQTNHIHNIASTVINEICLQINAPIKTWVENFNTMSRTHNTEFIGAHDLLELILYSFPKEYAPFDLLHITSRVLREHQLLLAPPIILGDLNWELNYLAIGACPWTYAPTLLVCFREGFKPKVLTSWNKSFGSDEEKHSWCIYYDKTTYSKLQGKKFLSNNKMLFN